MTERVTVNKPSRPTARPLRDLLGKVVGDAFTRQGFASAELVTRWPEIAGAEIAALSEPIKIQWPRVSTSHSSSAGEQASGWERPPGTLVLRVEGPAAIEIQHQSAVIVERVNRYFGWQALAGIALRQAPLARRRANPPRPKIDQELADAISSRMTGIADEGLRAALGRLGAAIKRT